VIIIVLISIAGLPFSGIFLLKFWLFTEIYKGGAVLLTIVLVLISIVQMYIYGIILLELGAGYGDHINSQLIWRFNLKEFSKKSFIEILLLIIIISIGFLLIISVVWVPIIISSWQKYFIYLFW
jgi:NADH:ubiquinone oxidoreductase subunit 2 (subunit N)